MLRSFSVLLLLAAPVLAGGKYNKVLAPGDAAPSGKTWTAPTARSTR